MPMHYCNTIAVTVVGHVTVVSRCDMRALCSVRGPLGGETRALGAGARLLSLRMPGQPQPLHFVVEAKAKVKELKALANAHAQLQGMTDTDLFGLAVMQNGEYLFVDLESKLSKYAPKSWRSSHTHGLDANGKPLLELHLVVQFHVESPLLLHDEVGRHLYFLQLRHNVRCRDTLPAEVLLLLTGLALQAQYGDADGYADRDYFKVEDYAPTSLTGDWVAAAMRACHREHRGLSRIDAESRFIREVCLLPDTMNSHRYRLKQNKSEPDPGTIWLFVTAKGIKILPDNGPVSNFIWTSIGKLSFDRKKFEIRTEDGKITLYSSSEEKCKYLFALCKETHQFSMKIAPKFKEILSKEEEERKICYGYPKSLNLQYIQNKSEQRISVISSTSSNTTSGIVSDRVQSEDELEIMIDSPPAPSTESLAFAHLLDCTNAYFIQHTPDDNKPFAKTSSLQLQKAKLRNKKNLDEIDTIVKNDISTEIGQSSRMQIEETISLPDQSITEISTDNTRNLLSASELTDLIVGRGVYPKSQSVSDTLDSVSDYVRLPLPFSGDSYLQGYEDTAPSDDNYPDNSFFDRPPTPPTRTDSRKMLNLSLPNILNIDENTSVMPKFHDKPPPPYEYNHKTLSAQLSTPTKAPPAYPGTAVSSLPLKQQGDKEEVAARVVTSRPMITILKAEAGEVNASSERTFASPMVLEHRFQKSKRHQASSRRAERSKLAQGICSLSPSRELPPTHHGVNANVLVAMMKLPPPPPPPRRTRLPPPPPVSRLPPPPPPHNSMFHQQLYSDVDYVYYPIQDPAISQQNYLDHKLTESRVSNMHKNSLQYRSTPYLSTSLSASSMYGSIQNLSDSYVQLPGTRTSWYSLTSRTSLSNHSTNLERPPIPTRLSEISSFTRARSHENVLNAKDPPPVKMRRMPPPPPPPYEHKKKLPSHLQELKASNCVYNDANVVNKVKDANCDLDIKTLREKSKNLDLPLIAALCNDRSLLKQTKAFGMPKLSKQTFSDCESERKCAKSVQSTTDSIDLKIKQESNIKRDITGSQKKILMRNPTDKLPALPGTATHTPRAMSNTYVIHPSVAKTKKIQPNS
ncbi:protein expanded isoform X3 [Hyposmocoma kahamanoa]|uniref:protein expanded isoform X3 n=1 Tax=Hyposmocoma kahamanoa TaxID=1477025 RepID=UPI000E6D8C3A|nr:protein expanded isoform X3 [Hyposmocoma kahamanoa]